MTFRNPFGTISKALVALSLVASLAAGCGGSAAAPATLVSIDVAPTTASVAVGSTQTFVATAHYSDKTTKNISTTATWASSATATATVSATGVATGVAAGMAMISATSAGISGAATLTVTSTNPPPPPPTAKLTSIAVTPAAPMIGVGLTQQFSVTGTYDDASTKDVTAMATWTSGTTATATISATGLATAVAKGTSMITATVGTLTGSATLTVIAPPVLKTIAVTPAAPTVAKGTTAQLTATGTYDDGSTKDLTATVTWASADMTKATISAAGVATGVAGGTSMITATSGGISGSVTLTVTEAMLVSIAVTPDAPTVSVGLKVTFKATGTFKDPATNATTTQDLPTATWSSSMTTIATIAATGEATGVAVGDTVIKATSGTVSGMTTLHVKALTLKTIMVTTQTPSIAKGTTATFVATGTFEDSSTQNLTTQVTWTSSIPGTATVSTAGVATSVAKGTTDITATLNGVMGKVTLTVTDAILKTIAVTAELPAANNNSFAKNTKVQLDAIGTFSDGSKQDLTETVTWTSSMAAITVSNAAGSRGLATAGNAAGMSTLTATVGTGATAISGSLMLTVNNVNLVSMVITPATFSLAAGFSQQFTATGFFSDTSRQDLTETAAWTSDKVATATVSNVAGTKGLAKGVAMGDAVLTASIGNNPAVTATAALNVKSALPRTLEISPANPQVALGTTTTLSVQGTFTDGSKQDLTNVVTWSSEKTNIATISNAAGSNGKVSPIAMGTSTITASYTYAPNQTLTGTTVLTVSTALLKSIAVTAAGSVTTIEKATTLQLTATGTYTDGTTANLTKAVTWAASNAKATVSNTAATAGLVTAVDTGAVTISATSTAPSSTNQPVVGSLDLTINDGKLLSIAVTPATPSIAIGTKLQFVATGTFNDGAKQDITSSVTWSSDAATKATVDGAGLAAGVAEGTANITATKGTGADAIAGSTKLTVKAVTLSSVVVTPNDPAKPNSIAKGTTLQFKATGFFSDTTTQDLTDTATWSAAMPTIVAISNDPATNGLATAAAVGNTSVTATVVIGAKTVASTPVMIGVTMQTLQSVAITPSPASVAKGATLNLVATGTFSDGSTQVLTNTATWSTAAAATATVSNANNQHGRVTGVAVGMVEITATSTVGGITKAGKITVNVTPAAIASINVTVANATVAKNATRQFTATATLTDGTKKDVSSTATWASADPTIATVSTTGLATGVAAGTAQITATQDTIVSNKVTLTVTP
jgi:uncharacterized protein YjdB